MKRVQYCFQVCGELVLIHKATFAHFAFHLEDAKAARCLLYGRAFHGYFELLRIP
jgi:hypothetical protein